MCAVSTVTFAARKFRTEILRDDTLRRFFGVGAGIIRKISSD